MLPSLIPLINKIQEIFLTTNLKHLNFNLPQIAVVGSQSAGKTSVLESIVGKDFLPRGSGIVTRRPLVLQLIHKDTNTEWAEFSHIKNQKFRDFSAVRKEIEDDTERVAGSNKGVSDIPIILQIYSNSLIDLTLIDLPGITKLPLGDQPDDIENKIKSIIFKYIKDQNTIILAVSPANADLSTSEALKIAAEVDPEKVRTIGVITKLDLMDKGTNAVDILSGKVHPLKYGYIGVICRSQQDINNGKTIQEALKSEEQFFANNEHYSFYKSSLGIPYLSKTLNHILRYHIKSYVPTLKSKIKELLLSKEQELRVYGSENPCIESNKGALLLKYIGKYKETYSQILHGDCHDTSNVFIGGARINYIFQNVFSKEINQLDPMDNLDEQKIRTAIINAKGLSPSIFVPEQAFETLIRQQILRLKQPAENCVYMIYEELRKISNKTSFPELTNYEVLRQCIMEVMENVLAKCLKPTLEMVSNLIRTEKSFININHPDFKSQAILSQLTSAYGDKEEEANQELDKSQFGHKSYKLIPNQKEEEKKKEKKMPKINTIQELENESSDSIFNISKNVEEEHGSIPTVPEDLTASKSSSQKEQMEYQLIKGMLTSYYKLVKKNICDSVPKAVMTFLVYESEDILQSELIKSLYKETKLEELMEETSYAMEKKKSCLDAIELLKGALKVTDQLRNEEESSLDIDL